MERLKYSLRILKPVDFIVIVFFVLLTIINLIFVEKIDNSHVHLIGNVLIIFSVLLIAHKANSNNNIFWRQLHYWYLVPLIFITFKELYHVIISLRGSLIDDILINIDRIIFNCDPTDELTGISFPLLTEILQIAYSTFFFLPIILGINLITTNKCREYEYCAFIIVYGFFLSYIGYFIFPAIGPRFTLHDFYLINDELPGIFLTNFLRDIINAGESVSIHQPNAASIVQRDAFPSGHTQVTLLVIYLSLIFKSKTKYLVIPVGTLLIFATVYLRYHYVVDLIGGVVFMIITIVTGKPLFNWWNKFDEKKIVTGKN
ncbi:MAG: phosphatase PAP2 family protein [Ignavibacteria bacterium]|jgi:membrane-associated phospholipid phosphatase